MSNRPSIQPHFAAQDIVNIVNKIDRKGNAYTENSYTRSGTYADDSKIPTAGAFAEAGVGRARAELSVMEVEARGPNVLAGAEANPMRASAMARAEVGSVSANLGLLGVKLGLGVDTGASVGADGVEVKVLGTGFSIGSKTSVSLLGSEVSCSVM